MMENNNNKYVLMSNNALVEQIGEFIKYNRLQQNKTQELLASESGINRSTLSQFESGKGGNLITLMQLLRALNLLSIMEHFEIKIQLSPLQLAKIEEKKRKRASREKTNTKKPDSELL